MSPSLQFLPKSTWQEIAKQHLTQIQEITLPMRERRARREKHPILDFLNTYYSFSLGRLEKWHPGPGITLEDGDRALFPEKYYTHSPHTTIAPRLLTEKGRQRLIRIHNLLTLIHSRPPHLACHGLHEWAMVHTGADIRHRESAPLRLPQQQIDHLVTTHPLTCSHFDAYRFFAPTAAPLNKFNPTLDSREQYEQPGCIHTNMDLYKWAYKSSPWISSQLLQQTLQLAIHARTIDMQASPYDLSAWNLSPIKIETLEGRREYQKLQLQLAEKSKPIRQQLINQLSLILQT